MNYRGVDKAKQIVDHGVQKVSDMLSTSTFNMLLLLFVNILWFLPHLNNGLIMGDDIGEIACSNLSLMDAFTMGGAKYRPVYTFLCILITRCFHGNYQLYFALNIVVNTIVSVLVYLVIKRATKGRSFLSVILH